MCVYGVCVCACVRVFVRVFVRALDLAYSWKLAAAVVACSDRHGYGTCASGGDHISRAAPSCHCRLPVALCEIGPFHFVYQFVSHAGKRSLNGLILYIYIYYIMYTCLYVLCAYTEGCGQFFFRHLILHWTPIKLTRFFPTLCRCHHHEKPIRKTLTRAWWPAISAVEMFRNICV